MGKHTRRGYIGSIAALCTGGLLKYRQNPPEQIQDNFYSPETDFSERYGNSKQEAGVENADITLDAIYVEGEDFSTQNKDYIQNLFDENNIDLCWIENTYEVPQDNFYTEYGPVTDKVLAEQDSLYDQMVDDLNEDFIQSFFIPGIREGENEGKVRVESCSSVDYAKGFAGCYEVPEARFLVTDPGPNFSDDLRKVRYCWETVHELGHTLGLEHDDESVVMGFEKFPHTLEEIDFSQTEWSRIRETLG